MPGSGQDRVSTKPLAPFCTLLTLKQVRMGPNQFLIYNRLKMGTVVAKAPFLGARRAREGLSGDISEYLDQKPYISKCCQNRDFKNLHDSS